MIDRFIYLRTGLALVLAFVGTKMIVTRFFVLPNTVSLLVIVFILAVTITISMYVTKRRDAAAAAENEKSN